MHIVQKTVLYNMKSLDSGTSNRQLFTLLACSFRAMQFEGCVVHL